MRLQDLFADDDNSISIDDPTTVEKIVAASTAAPIAGKFLINLLVGASTTDYGVPYNGKFVTVDFDNVRVSNVPHVDMSDDKATANPIIWYHYGGMSTLAASQAYCGAAKCVALF